jgi:hypothetical protein
MERRLARAQKGAWKAEWQIQKQRDHITYLERQCRDSSSSARRYLNFLIERLRWYEREIERIRKEMAEPK